MDERKAKCLIFQVSIGPPSRLYETCNASVRAYAARIGAHYQLVTEPRLKIAPDPLTSNRSAGALRLSYLPIFEKEVALDVMADEGYDAVAVIDSDVYVRPTCSASIFADLGDADFGAVVERDMPITEEYARKIWNYSWMQYSRIHGVDFSPNRFGHEFMNMGVMVMSRNVLNYTGGLRAREFILQPRWKPFVDGAGAWKWSTDQTLLNVWVRSSGMKLRRLPWKWNGLYGANTRLKECSFLHFFLRDKLPNRGENIQELLRQV